MAEFFGQFGKGLKPIYVAGIEAVKDYTEERSTIRKKVPKIRLLINPFFPPFLPIEFISEDFGGIITGANWTKSRSQANGSFTLELAADDTRFADKLTGWPLNKIWKSMGASLRDLFKPMTLGQLWMDGYHVMTGYLRGCRKTLTTDKKSYTIQFDELGALYNQNILKSYFIEVGEELFLTNSPSKGLDAAANLFGTMPLSYAINLYVNFFLGSSLNYGLKSFPTPYLSGSDLLPLAFRMVAQPTPIGGISNSSLWTHMPTDANIQQFGGSSFWDFLKHVAPEPFIEMFTESGGRTICTGKLVVPSSISSITTGGIMAATSALTLPIPGINVTPMLPGFNYLIMRTMPYDNPLLGISPWHPTVYPFTLGVFDLLTAGDFVIITDEDVIEKDLGVSDAQQYTCFDVNYNGKNASGGTASGSSNRPSISSGPTLPIFPGGIRTYGPRLLETGVNASSVQWGGIALQSIQRFTRKLGPGANIRVLSTLLNVWFRNAAKFNEGTITTRGIPYARPGMVLLYLPTYKNSKVDDPRDIGIYYIDNTVNNYRIGSPDTTTFSVIRGTPIPNTIANLVTWLMDWEISPPGLNIFDGEI